MADCNVVNLDLCVRRGDKKDLVFTIPNVNLLTGTPKIYFTAKENKSLTSARYIDKSNQVAGEMTVSFNSPDTEITIHLVPEDTQDLQVNSLVCDLQVDSLLDAENIVTYADGTLAIEFDVRTEFDNYDLPDVPVTFQQIDASDFKADEMLIVGLVEGQRTMIPITIADLKTKLGI